MMGRTGFPSFSGPSGAKAGDKGEKGTTERGKRGNSRKYVCPKCGNIIRATKAVNVICGDCNISFELEK